MSQVMHEPNSLSLAFVEGLYEQFQHDPTGLTPEWRAYFERAVRGNGFEDLPKPDAGKFDRTSPLTLVPQVSSRCSVCGRGEELTALQHRVEKLVRNYRVRGHRIARVDPLGLPLPVLPELDPAYHELSDEHMGLPFATTLDSSGMLPLREIIERLQNTYCRFIGVQFMHIDDLSVREWLQGHMELSQNRLHLTRREQLRIFTRLTDAVTFEEFIRRKFVGAKRFSLEGCESLIPLLDLAIEQAGDHGMDEIVIGMAHRGRLNVLANILGKSPREIFREFEDADAAVLAGRGDVKYHQGYHNDWTTTSGRVVHLGLCFTPSHLEFVNPVAMGRVRGKQDRLGDLNHERGMAILIHGDASFAGEGIVQESLNLSELEAYTAGGTLHVIVNNQIGFTTPPSEGRSTVYASDVAKMLQIPIFHVNGEDPEAVAQVVRLGMEFRRRFKRDVVIDMYGYRRYGHNEGDEPTFTQPLLYRAIKNRKSVRDGYLEHLLKLRGITPEEADAIAEARRELLEKALSSAHDPVAWASRPSTDPGGPPVSPSVVRPKSGRTSVLGRVWKPYKGGFDKDVPEVDTAVEAGSLSSLLEATTRMPHDFHPHPKIVRWLEERKQMADGKLPLDWGAAEALAFATLAAEGFRVRLSGQDTARGTFSHRHAVLYDFEDGHPYMPLQHVAADQAPVEVLNSPLSEAGVLAFEYGYCMACPDGLVLWEAQFGDFANVAQVLIDQAISSGEDKWGSLCGLVLLLPHGLEGMGPEHSSARLERFLTLAAEDNIQIVNCTTPAQFFHCLRRQVVRPWRKPLIVMTPKSLLRNPKSVSTLEDLAKGRFDRILSDATTRAEDVKRVLLCSGKVYYDLIEERERRAGRDVAILRFEQLYPLQDDYIESALAPYPHETPVVWVQEEPENMGAWPHLRARFCERVLGKWPFMGVSRPASASPATGSHGSHKIEQETLITTAFS